LFYIPLSPGVLHTFIPRSFTYLYPQEFYIPLSPGNPVKPSCPLIPFSPFSPALPTIRLIHSKYKLINTYLIVSVHFVDIGGIVDHHCSKPFSIIN
jgi:hypothetical protein